MGFALSYYAQSSGVSSITALNNGGGENANINIGFGAITTGGIPTNSVIKITQNGYFRLNSGTAGIQFGGDTAAANALDDYEEGTFTVDITQGGTSFGTPLARSGFYTKIGRQVTISFYWYATSGAPSLTGGIKVSGIPFTPSGNAYTASVGYYSNNGVNYGEATPHRVQWNSGSGLDLYGANSSTSWTTSVFEISGVFTYFV